MKIIEKLKAIKAILFADEYFVSVANQNNPYGKTCDGPIVYEYFSNTDRNVFYIFVKNYLEKLNNLLEQDEDTESADEILEKFNSYGKEN